MVRWGVAVLACVAGALNGQIDCIYVPICGQVDDTPVIFVGRVLDHTSYHYHFAIDEVFKGIKAGTQEVTVDVTLYGGLAQGRRYLILAKSFGESAPYVTQCGGEAKHIEEAQDDLKFLRQWATRRNVTRLQGRVAENVEDSMVSYALDQEHRPGLASVEITATADGRESKGSTDQRGYFEVALPGEGDYIVTAHLAGHVSHHEDYEVSVEPNSCAEQNIGMWIDSAVSGRVTDEAGRPVRGLPVDIQPVNESGNRVSGSAETDEDGRYDIRKLPAGEYILGVNLGGLNSSVPYPPRFYPGVGQREKAEVIKIEGPQRIVDRDFTIEARKETRRITVTVRWPDGGPVTNADVRCAGAKGRGDYLSKFTDQNGSAVFDVLTDREFHVEADRLFWSHSSRPLQPLSGRSKFTVPPGKTAAAVEITIEAVNDIRDKEIPVDMSPYNKKP